MRAKFVGGPFQGQEWNVSDGETNILVADATEDLPDYVADPIPVSENMPRVGRYEAIGWERHRYKEGRRVRVFTWRGWG